MRWKKVENILAEHPHIKDAIKFTIALETVLVHDYKITNQEAKEIIELGSEYNFNNTFEFLAWVHKKRGKG